MTKELPIKKPLRIAGLVWPDGKFKYVRENSGALILVEGTDDDETRRIGTIDMQIRPKRGEGWRHYKGGLYEIVGTGHDEASGNAIVIYTDYMWPLAQAPSLWSRPLSVFLGFTEDKKRRFQFEREPGTDSRYK